MKFRLSKDSMLDWCLLSKVDRVGYLVPKNRMGE